MSFFYNLNKTLDAIREKPELTHGQLNERDMGKHNNATTGFKALAAKTNDKIAGSKFQKMKKAHQLEETGMDEGAYQAGPDKSQIPAVNRPGNKMTLQDLEKERNQSPTTADGMRALQNKLKNIHPMDPQEGVDKEAFAALAPPKNKITFADKIAGAKKEVDEMLGDVAAEAMKNALGGHSTKSLKAASSKDVDADRKSGVSPQYSTQQVKGELKRRGEQVASEEEDLNPFTNYKKPRADQPKPGDVEHGSKHDIKHGTTDPRYSGRIVTRRSDAQGMSVGSETDDEGNQHEKRGRGRPKGAPKAPERVTSKATKHKDGRKVKEGDFGPMEEGSGDLKAAMALLKKAGYKISKAVEEEKTTTRDDRAEKAGKRVAKDIEYDEKKKDGIHGKKRDSEDDKAEKAGKRVAKDIEYDEKKKDDKPKKVKEAGGTDTPTASSGFSYGQGIYDSINHEIEKMIAESMSMNMSDSTDGTKSLTITATDEDAVKLSMLLNTAGIGGGDDSEGYGGSGYKSACGCGTPDCSCGDQEMDEAAPTVSDNEPDWPTNTEEGDALQYSGGLDGPKPGQSTLTGGGIPNLDADRQHGYAEAEEDALHRMMEMAGIKKKEVDEEKTAEGNLFTKGLEDNNVKVGEKIPGTNAIKKKDIDESIFTLTNQWKAYKG